MGKTKLNVISGEPEVKGKKKLSYEEKRALRSAESETSNSVTQNSEKPKTDQPETENRELKTENVISSPVKIERAGAETKKQKNQVTKERGKKYDAAKAKVEVGRVYPLSEAAKLVRETSYSKFGGSVELHLSLDKSNVSQQVELPHSTGVSRKVEVVDDNTIQKLEAGKVDFDVLIATPQTMPMLVKYAKLLGPKGLMPNPKNGTLVDDPKKVMGNFGGNNLQVRTEKSAPLVHTVVAKISQSEVEIEENTQAVINALGAKSIKKAVLTASIGPSIQFAV